MIHADASTAAAGVAGRPPDGVPTSSPAASAIVLPTCHDLAISSDCLSWMAGTVPCAAATLHCRRCAARRFIGHAGDELLPARTAAARTMIPG